MNRIIHSGVAARRVVLQSHSTCDLVRLLGVKELVNPVKPIEHGVVEEEGGIVGAGVEIGVVTVDGVVTSGVKTEELVRITTLDLRPEATVSLGGFTDGDVEEVLGPVPLAHSVAVQVTSNAARVVVCKSLDDGTQTVHSRVEGTNVGLSAE